MTTLRSPLSPSSPLSPTSPSEENDLAVIKTNDEAAQCKLTLTDLGYIKDPFVQHFVKRVPSKSPLINRGYFARVHLIHSLIHTFTTTFAPISTNNTTPAKVQVVNLGAGFDTTYWNMKHDPQYAGIDIKFIEVDFADVVTRKIKIIEHTSALRATLQNCAISKDSLESDDYFLFSVDLRHFDEFQKLLVERAKLDTTVPTLFLSECVLVYMDAKYSDKIVEWSGTLDSSMFIVYEQVNPHDSFGKTMVHNLIKRNCPLKSIYQYPTSESQRKRFISRGYTLAASHSMKNLYLSFLDAAEKKRTERLEILDEFEEWYMLMDHYAITVALRFPATIPHLVAPSPTAAAAASLISTSLSSTSSSSTTTTTTTTLLSSTNSSSSSSNSSSNGNSSSSSGISSISSNSNWNDFLKKWRFSKE